MLVVVGGHSRNIGKTALIAAIIRNFRDLEWTAVKVSRHAHASPQRDAVHLQRESGPGATDAGRFLEAGARKSYLLSIPEHDIRAARDTVLGIIAGSNHVIVESNSILEIVEPNVFLMVINPSCGEFKPSSMRYMSRADGFVVVGGPETSEPQWPADMPWGARPRFFVQPPDYAPPAVCAFLKAKFSPVCC